MKKLQIIFTAAILALIFLPAVFFDTKRTVAQKENRSLAAQPPLLHENHLNQTLFAEYDDYFQDRLGFRDQLIELNTKNPLRMEKGTTVGRAIAGKDGWYFFTDPTGGNNLMDFYKRNLLDDTQQAQFADRVSSVVEWCASQGIPCIFLICPNKHSVYSEFYPFDRPDGITRAEQITAIFEELGIPYLFPRDFLLAKKADFDFPLYYETDTHWNPQGAYLAPTLLREQIESLFPGTEFPQIEYETSISQSETYGDLLPMLNIQKSPSTQVSVLPIGHKNADFYIYLKNKDRNDIRTKGADETLPRALIFRDSFFTALEPFVSPLFSEAEYMWRPFTEAEKAYILEYKPDIIIFEKVERNSLAIVQ